MGFFLAGAGATPWAGQAKPGSENGFQHPDSGRRRRELQAQARQTINGTEAARVAVEMANLLNDLS